MLRPPVSTLFPYTTLFRSTRPWRPRHPPRAPDRRPLHDQHLRADQRGPPDARPGRSEEHTSELQSHSDLVCRLLLEKKNHRYLKNSANHSTNLTGDYIDVI